MKKICYIVTLPMTIEAFFIPQLKYLSNNDFIVDVICSKSDTLQEKLGDRINYIPIEIPRGISIVGMLKAIKTLIKIFRNNKYDMIQYSTPNASFCAVLAGKISKINIRNYHLMGFRYLGAQGVNRKILKLFEIITCKLSTSIECVSYSNKNLGVSEKIFNDEKAIVVWNGSTGGVDLKRFDFNKRGQWRKEIRNELGYSDSEFVFGYVGRITRDKGINELLDAFMSMDNSSKLLLVGNIEDNNNIDINLLKNAKKCSRIKFHEKVDDIERFYAAIDVLVLPSYREGFGNVIIEAAAVGTPAIISDIPGPIDAVIKDKTAFLVQPHNKDMLYYYMTRIIMCDYASMGFSAYEYVKNCFDSKILCEYILKRKQNFMKFSKI
ncbi:MAG TPA: glycosyltransferase [Candidatus Erysipelatoclostridium merdavium]|uniref:Glycosyltransferase n=1 Tax=Candidatus Erysipelatoclostridium merdavium TaxID=2838566 RepID=A0A9D1XLM0_9FIRM|nr:glycosyltransferase [Candidatus Erysipelatoclostridium merdavium]